MRNGLKSVTYWLPVTLAAARAARQRVIAACEGLPDEQRDVAALLTSELVTNAVRHARWRDEDHRRGIRITLRRTERRLRVEVTDPDDRLPRPAGCPPSPRESGWGLYLVSQLSTNWGSHPAGQAGGKVVWFELSTAD